MRIYISGGCKNGKSTLAQRLAVIQGEGGPLYYVATMIPTDGEDRDRIRRHRDERKDMGFETIELGRDIGKLPELCSVRGSFLVDSMTALLANEMFPPGGEMNPHAGEKIQGELAGICGQIQNIVLVSDYLYSDAISYDRWTEAYRSALGAIDRRGGACCDILLESVYGNVVCYKGNEEWREHFEGFL